jgi:hypothetical protein
VPEPSGTEAFTEDDVRMAAAIQVSWALPLEEELRMSARGDSGSEDLAAVLRREIAKMLANTRNTRELLTELAAETRAPAGDV